MLSKNQSARVEVKLDEAAITAIDKIKDALQEQVEFDQPDFTKLFELTTDASNQAIGAVFSQFRHPIAFISRTLTDTEKNYKRKRTSCNRVGATEAPKFLYGITDLTIYTDHQSLINFISEKTRILN